MEYGVFALCHSRESENEPFCDGTHETMGFEG